MFRTTKTLTILLSIMNNACDPGDPTDTSSEDTEIEGYQALDTEEVDDAEEVVEKKRPVGEDRHTDARAVRFAPAPHDDDIASLDTRHPPQDRPASAGDLPLAAENQPSFGGNPGLFTKYWHQNNGSPTFLGYSGDLFCFLGSVSGQFDGAGESVRVYIDQNGYWWLGGTSQRTGVAGHAVCIPRDYWGQELAISQAYTWSQVWPGAVYLGSDTNTVCFLTRVVGSFKGAGEWVGVYRSGGSWWLGGGSQQAGVGASARCVNSDYRAGVYKWQSGQAATVMANQDEWACGLSWVQGDLRTWVSQPENTTPYELKAMTMVDDGLWPNWALNGIGTLWSRAYCM
jgi:hypothetical protein